MCRKKNIIALKRILYALVFIFALWVVSAALFFIKSMYQASSLTRNHMKPMSNEGWFLLCCSSNGGTIKDLKTGEDVSFNQSAPHGDYVFSLILMAVGPVNDVVRNDEKILPDYIIIHPGARDPVHISVSVKDDFVYFKVDEFWYQGGASSVFKEVLKCYWNSGT